MKIITDPSEIDLTSWRNFVLNHPAGNCFHTPEYYYANLKAKRHDPISVFCIDKDQVSGCIIGVVEKEINGFLGVFTARTIVRGGPLVRNHNTKILKHILEKFDSLAKRKSLYTQLRNLDDVTNLKESLISFKYKLIPHLNFLIDCRKDEEELWASLQTKARNLVRRAGREGLIVESRTDIDSLKKSYSILTEVYNRAKIPLAGWDYFEAIQLEFSESCKIVNHVALKGNAIVGCMITLCYKERVYDFYAGSLVSANKLFPNYIIPWEVIRWAKANGYNTFDFGGAGHPNKPYGVREYKKKFGGDLVDYGRFLKINKPIIYSVLYSLFHIRKTVLK